jgi:phage virion morphogenesis protein
MAGAGVEVGFDGEYQKIIDALHRASAPTLQEIAHAGGLALQKISHEAFKNEADPATGEKWKALKNPRGKSAKHPGSTSPVLNDRGTLKRSIIFQGFSDGSVVLGSNLVYAGVHQWGGDAGRGRKSKIPARSYLGAPRDFERQFFDDPAIKAALGIAAGGGA